MCPSINKQDKKIVTHSLTKGRKQFMSPKKRSSSEQRRLRAQQIMFVILAAVVILSMVISLIVK